MEYQHFLQDLLTISCSIQANLEHLQLVNTRQSLEAKSNDIKALLKEFKEKLQEMKDFYDIHDGGAGNNALSHALNYIMGSHKRRNSTSTDAASVDDDALSMTSVSSLITSSAASRKDVFLNELQNQKDDLYKLESRFRNAYFAAQMKFNEQERDSLLLDSSGGASGDATGEKTKKMLDKQMQLRMNTQITSKMDEISKQIQQSLTQTSDTLPLLENSSQKLKSTQDEFASMSVFVRDGKRLLTRLGQREFTDKLLIVICLCFFFTVVFYIIWKRLLIRFWFF